MKLGIIQGRLSPYDPNCFQRYPEECWQEEFVEASKLGFQFIEWLLVTRNWENNLIWTAEGRSKILIVSKNTGVYVKTLCADYFMDYPFFRESEKERRKSIKVLSKLIDCCQKLEVTTILLPVLEKSAIRSEEEKALLINSLKEVAPLAEKSGVTIGLEMELDSSEYLQIIDNIGSNFIKIYYDTGNLGARGNNTLRDLVKLKDHIAGIHLKDRLLKGKTVPLGKGNANLNDFLKELAKMNFDKPVILQPYFDEDYLYWAEENLNFVKNKLKEI